MPYCHVCVALLPARYVKRKIGEILCLPPAWLLSPSHRARAHALCSNLLVGWPAAAAGHRCGPCPWSEGPGPRSSFPHQFPRPSAVTWAGSCLQAPIPPPAPAPASHHQSSISAACRDFPGGSLQTSGRGARGSFSHGTRAAFPHPAATQTQRVSHALARCTATA